MNGSWSISCPDSDLILQKVTWISMRLIKFHEYTMCIHCPKPNDIRIYSDVTYMSDMCLMPINLKNVCSWKVSPSKLFLILMELRAIFAHFLIWNGKLIAVKFLRIGMSTENASYLWSKEIYDVQWWAVTNVLDCQRLSNSTGKIMYN